VLPAYKPAAKPMSPPISMACGPVPSLVQGGPLVGCSALGIRNPTSNEHTRGGVFEKRPPRPPTAPQAMDVTRRPEQMMEATRRFEPQPPSSRPSSASRARPRPSSARPASASLKPTPSDPKVPFGILAGIEREIAAGCSAEARVEARSFDLTRLGSAAERAEPHYHIGAAPPPPRPQSRGRRPASAHADVAGNRTIPRDTPGPTWGRRWSTVPRLFDSLAENAPPERTALFFGTKHRELQDKVRRMLEDEFEDRKRASSRERDGRTKRSDVEAKVSARPKTMSFTGRAQAFSDTPLLSTSEAAVRYYLRTDMGDDHPQLKFFS